ncbi:response regulator transcription factor [Alkalibacter saccharofermentans]|uniref:Stage 0 sporulation protein A homolog n=1 Tax=Alkalibacter saccharofermentans DSM 14828 TaxID=1120975 RepID=A0A1M4S4E7_9FIRM|nr:response regulator transcription factor [Alkalibacter saccharofermentans]SHE27083.1 two-component system, OmpR family, alkaline phosphatase synthesis response regulator PhoP [Alkalibacter saccharofermentans DSM 14828]
MNKKIAIIEDEANIYELIKFNLEKNGYDVFGTQDGTEAGILIEEKKPDLVILDLMLPNKDGLTILRELRETKDFKETPVIILTARETEFDKVLGLEIGADDYLTKPFSIKELIARIKAVLRRISSDEADESIIKFDDLEVHQDAFKVYKKGELLSLTLKEYELLALLIKNKGKVLNRNFLLDTIWGYDYIGETRTVDVHIRHLRQKIEEDDTNPIYIETVRGVGYRFRD